jgi:hypothetical protein
MGRHGAELVDNTGFPLYHPLSWVNWYGHIVIGRRSDFNEKELETKASFLKTRTIEVMTYDRLLDTAKKLDASKGNERVHRTGRSD